MTDHCGSTSTIDDANQIGSPSLIADGTGCRVSSSIIHDDTVMGSTSLVTTGVLEPDDTVSCGNYKILNIFYGDG